MILPHYNIARKMLTWWLAWIAWIITMGKMYQDAHFTKMCFFILGTIILLVFQPEEPVMGYVFAFFATPINGIAWIAQLQTGGGIPIQVIGVALALALRKLCSKRLIGHLKTKADDAYFPDHPHER